MEAKLFVMHRFYMVISQMVYKNPQPAVYYIIICLKDPSCFQLFLFFIHQYCRLTL